MTRLSKQGRNQFSSRCGINHGISTEYFLSPKKHIKKSDIRIRSLDLVWAMIDELGHDFEVEKHTLYLLRNAEKDQVLVLTDLVVTV